MIYLDYAANTPVDPSVLEKFCEISRNFYGNPNALHQMGVDANRQMEDATKKITEILKTEQMEVIYTSGASEANNMAIKGIASAFRDQGKHIISTCLEHSSVSAALTYLQSTGYEINLVDIKEDGTVDLNHLRELLRADTILVTIGYVDSELGVIQPIADIAKIVHHHEKCFFHVDATQAIGKIQPDFHNIDLITFTPHKFYGLNGMGILLRNERAVLTPLIHGGSSTSIYRSGTPVPAAAQATAMALELAFLNFGERAQKVSNLLSFLKQHLEKYPKVRINSPNGTCPFILNLSVKGIPAADMQRELDMRGFCISTKSACSVIKLPSRAVFAVTKDKKNAKCSFRISLSHLTEIEELEEFLKAFDAIYKTYDI